MDRFTGLYVATLTPFDTSDRLDFAALRKHTEFLIKAGVSGICPCGTTGEWLYLRIGEKARLIEAATAAAAGRVKVIAGVGAIDAKEIVLLARNAESVGADAVFLTPPIYYPASDEQVYRHYAAVRESCALSVFAYNIPSHAANAISLDCLTRMVEDGVVAGIKDSTASAERMTELVSRFAGRITVMAASDSFATEGRQLGAHGFISALANIWPESFCRLWAGDDTIQPAVDSARKAVKSAGGIPALKFLAELIGCPVGAARIPFAVIDPAKEEALRGAYARSMESGLC